MASQAYPTLHVIRSDSHPALNEGDAPQPARIRICDSNEKLLIFGNPTAGTPVMIASPTIAIDLPLKILVWEDGSGQIWVSYNRPAYLQARHNVPPHLVQNIAVVEALASKAAE